MQAEILGCIPKLRQHLRRRLRCEEDAKDIAQEACLRTLTVLQGKELRNPRAYLYQVAHNLVYHHYTSNRIVEVADMDVDALESNDTTPEDTAHLDERRNRIDTALNELPPKCQTAMILRWRKELRIKEIAAAMDLSVGMVKKYLAKGNSHLHKRLWPLETADCQVL